MPLSIYTLQQWPGSHWVAVRHLLCAGENEDRADGGRVSDGQDAAHPASWTGGDGGKLRANYN